MKNMKKVLALALVIVSVLSVAAPAFAAQTNTNSVNIRKSASTSGALLGQVANGTTLTVLSEVNGSSLNGSTLWLKVKVIKCAAGSKHNIDGQTGYVHSSFVSGYSTGSTGGTGPQTMLEAFGPNTLQSGATGKYVKNVQYALRYHGLLPSSDLSVDGTWGYDTQNAVLEYQSRFGLDKDGFVGPETKNHMWNYDLRLQAELKKNGVK